jgi:hypothetical protein
MTNVVVAILLEKYLEATAGEKAADAQLAEEAEEAAEEERIRNTPKKELRGLNVDASAGEIVAFPGAGVGGTIGSGESVASGMHALQSEQLIALIRSMAVHPLMAAVCKAEVERMLATDPTQAAQQTAQQTAADGTARAQNEKVSIEVVTGTNGDGQVVHAPTTEARPAEQLVDLDAQ